jgi:hypothetical protein
MMRSVITGSDSSPSAREQLEAIKSLSEVLDQERLDFWLFGGWAVDFCVGAMTREHEDIDVAAWRHDYDAIKEALEAAGWRHAPVADEVVGTRYRMGSAEAEFTFVIADDEGRVVVPRPEHPIMWAEESFGHERRELHGVATRTVPLALLREGKSVPREDEAGGAKDRADYDVLMRVEDTS